MTKYRIKYSVVLDRLKVSQSDLEIIVLYKCTAFIHIWYQVGIGDSSRQNSFLHEIHIILRYRLIQSMKTVVNIIK